MQFVDADTLQEVQNPPRQPTPPPPPPEWEEIPPELLLPVWEPIPEEIWNESFPPDDTSAQWEPIPQELLDQPSEPASSAAIPPDMLAASFDAFASPAPLLNDGPSSLRRVFYRSRA